MQDLNLDRFPDLQILESPILITTVWGNPLFVQLTPKNSHLTFWLDQSDQKTWMLANDLINGEYQRFPSPEELFNTIIHQEGGLIAKPKEGWLALKFRSDSSYFSLFPPNSPNAQSGGDFIFGGNPEEIISTLNTTKFSKVNVSLPKKRRSFSKSIPQGTLEFPCSFDMAYKIKVHQEPQKYSPGLALGFKATVEIVAQEEYWKEVDQRFQAIVNDCQYYDRELRNDLATSSLSAEGIVLLFQTYQQGEDRPAVTGGLAVFSHNQWWLCDWMALKYLLQDEILEVDPAALESLNNLKSTLYKWVKAQLDEEQLIENKQRLALERHKFCSTFLSPKPNILTTSSFFESSKQWDSLSQSQPN